MLKSSLIRGPSSRIIRAVGYDPVLSITHTTDVDCVEQVRPALSGNLLLVASGVTVERKAGTKLGLMTVTSRRDNGARVGRDLSNESGTIIL